MKTARKLATALRLVAHLSTVTAGSAALVGSGALLSACADENDPQTWVKRLDDPAQKVSAIKRLTQFFDDAMSKNSGNRDAQPVKDMLDKIVEPLTKTYVAGGLDDKTRKELLKHLADMHDARTSPALAKALNDYDPGKNDEDVKYAAQGVKAMALDKKNIEQGVLDALWNTFGKWKASSPNAAFLARDIQDALMAVKHPSWGPKALEKIGAPIDPKQAADAQDQSVWQLISIQLIGHLQYKEAAKQLATILITPTKAQLGGAAAAALARMPKEGEPILLAALNGSDPQLKTLADAYPEKQSAAVICDALGLIGRSAGRDACLAVLDKTDNSNVKVSIALSLYKFPADGRVTSAYQKVYSGLSSDMTHAATGMNGKAILARFACNLHDASLTDFLLKDIASIKGSKDDVDAIQLAALESVIKLMTSSNKGAVGDATNKEGTDREKSMYKLAAAAVDRCKEDANCYLKILDEPIPSNTGTADMGAVKAAWMVGTLGKTNDGLRAELLKRAGKVSDPPTRSAIVQSILFMAPKGDEATATELEKIVKHDDEAGNANKANGDLSNVALSLRARTAN